MKTCLPYDYNMPITCSMILMSYIAMRNKIIALGLARYPSSVRNEIPYLRRVIMISDLPRSKDGNR